MEVCTLAKDVLLVLGAGPDQIPGLKKAKEMGVYTIVLDGNPEAEGFLLSDEKYVVNIKDLKSVESFITLEILAKNRLLHGVIAFGVDIPAIISRAMDMLNVNYTCNSTAAVLSEDKYLSKEFLRSIDIPIPAFKLVSTMKDVKDFIFENGAPVVIKPVDNSAARGVFLIQDLSDDVESLFNISLSLSKKKKVIIEKFLSGDQVSSESFVINGKAFNIGYADRNYDDTQKYFPNIIENGGDLPSVSMNKDLNADLTRYIETIVKNLRIKTCVMKGDLVVHDGKLYFIEFALRLSGGNFSSIEIPENTGVDFLKIAINMHLGKPIDEVALQKTKNDVISIRYLFPKDNGGGRILNVSCPQKVSDIIYYKMHAKEGDIISSGPFDHSKRLGFVITTGSSRQDAIASAQTFLNNIKIEVES